jgi:hypothetical protein
MSDVMRVHIGKEEWTLGEFVDAFLSYRGRSEKAEQDLAVERQLSSQLLKTSDNRAVLLEKAERERDAYKRDTYAELSGNAALRRDLGARKDETMCEFVTRLNLDCVQAKARTRELEYKAERCQACSPVCVSCEGPLTCAKCTNDTRSDHEARIKALEQIAHVHASSDTVKVTERKL